MGLINALTTSAIRVPLTLLWIPLLLVVGHLHFVPDSTGDSATRYFDLEVGYMTVTRLCNTKRMLAMNGQFPGPVLHVTEGDKVVARVTNRVSHNVTIHWHGVRQLLTCWSDGPAYITQCPIQTNRTFTYIFDIIDQRGTLFWHAHISWQRATVYGAFIIHAKQDWTYPFSLPDQDLGPTLLGEWWNADVDDILATALLQGGTYNRSDALTINGQPGPLYTCSKEGAVVYHVEEGKTYLIRLINAAVNFQMFFAIANHNLTVVEADAEYTIPFTTDVLVLAPGQTMTVKLEATSAAGTRHYMAASVYSVPSEELLDFEHVPATAVLIYAPPSTLTSDSNRDVDALPGMPELPPYNDTDYADAFYASLRSQSFSKGYYYMPVPQQVDHSLFITVGYALQPCPTGFTCRGPSGMKMAATLNNVSFTDPHISVLEAYYHHIKGVYDTHFPDVPPHSFDYVNSANLTISELATHVRVLAFNSSVEIVFQNTRPLFYNSHPMHLHGQNFYVVGSGKGNFDPHTDPASFNLIDPLSRNTVAVPAGGWAAVRFQALNPGVWYLHCHFDVHNSWGMSMAFIVLDGPTQSTKLRAPPSDLPAC